MYEESLLQRQYYYDCNCIKLQCFSEKGISDLGQTDRGFQFLPASLTSSVFTSQTTLASSSGTLCPADSRLSEGTSTHNSQHNMHIQPCNVLQKRNNKSKCIAYYTKYLDLPWKEISLH